MRLMDWGEKTYYRMSRGSRIRTYGYKQEGRVPKAVVRVWIMDADILN